MALSGVAYGAGDILELIEPTGQMPFGHRSRICNWAVKCKAFRPPMPQSIWSGIWLMVEDGYLEVLR